MSDQSSDVCLSKACILPPQNKLPEQAYGRRTQRSGCKNPK